VSSELAHSTPSEHAPDPNQRRFVTATLVSCFGLLAVVLALNVAMDPFATAGTGLVSPAVEDDRSIKLTLLDQLRQGTETLILGSSRARQAEPSFLRSLTGRSAFNAGVTGGTAADAWVFTRRAADRFPEQQRRYVWFIDAGVATNGVNPQLEADPRARKYLRDGGGFGLDDVGIYIGTEATQASWRVFKACVLGRCRPRIRYGADGSIARSSLRVLPEQAKSLERDVAQLVASIRAHPPVSAPVDPKRYLYFERTLAFMNGHGSRPVIVLNPIYPTVLAELEKYGFPERRAGLAYLRQLHRRYDFVVVDCQNIDTWGGSAIDWTNAKHVNRRNMRRMLRYIAAHSQGALG
jgi:hypothetical protein